MPTPKEWHEEAARILAREQDRTVDELSGTRDNRLPEPPVAGQAVDRQVVWGNPEHQSGRE